jgi:hypothetical protein
MEPGAHAGTQAPDVGRLAPANTMAHGIWAMLVRG